MAKRRTRTQKVVEENAQPVVEENVVTEPTVDVAEEVNEPVVEKETVTEQSKEVVETPKVEEPVEKEVTEPDVDFICQSELCNDLVKFVNDSKSIDIKNVTDILGSIDNYITVAKNSDKKTIMSYRYSLYLIIRGALENKDYNLFKQNLNLLNKAFIIDKSGLFNPVALLTDDYLWNYGSGSRVAFQLTITAISRLANVSTRKETLKIVDIRSILKYFNADASNNIIRYYNL